MNKTVLEYLSGKANDVKDYIVAKAEAAGNYLSDHATDIKDGLVKGTATVLTVATMLGGMTACNANTPSENPNNTPGTTITNPSNPGQQGNQNDNKITLRPREEIEQTGITAQDVLDLIDDLVRQHYYLANKKYYTEEEYHIFEETKYQFDYITPKHSFVCPDLNNPSNIEPMIDPMYIPLEKHEGYLDWLSKDIVLNDVYKIQFTYTTDYIDENGVSDEYQTTIKNFTISQTDLNRILDAFGVQKFDVTPEYLDSLGSVAHAYNNLLGQSVYPNTTIDRQMIKNATTEQLWVLYNAISNSLYKNNINGETQLENNNEMQP